MSKRRIEDVVNEALKDDAQRNALDFVAHLKTIGVTLDDSDNYFWNAVYKGKGMCVINVDTEHTSFDIFVNDFPVAWENGPVDERTKEIVWANVRPHDPTCHGKCSPGSRKVIFGKTFDNLCRSFLGIYTPDAKTTACTIKLMDGLKNDIDNATT